MKENWNNSLKMSKINSSSCKSRENRCHKSSNSLLKDNSFIDSKNCKSKTSKEQKSGKKIIKN